MKQSNQKQNQAAEEFGKFLSEFRLDLAELPESVRPFAKGYVNCPDYPDKRSLPVPRLTATTKSGDAKRIS